MGTRAVLVLLVASGSWAQDIPELVTDRPDQTESAVVVPRGSVQVESGVTFTHDEEETLEYPSTLVRVGLHERLELRLGFDGWSRVMTSGNEVELGDAELGLKLRLWDEEGWLPEAALLAGVSIPIGDDDEFQDRADPAFRLSLAHTLSERLSFGYNVGVAWVTVEDAPRWQLLAGPPTPPNTMAATLELVNEVTDADTLATMEYTAALGIGITERLGAFVEIFGEVPLNAHGEEAHSLDGGFTYLLRPNVQLDLAAGVGLNDSADDWFVGAGVSCRLPR